MASGTIKKDIYRQLLWSNSGNSWGTETITLTSSDYDYLEVQFLPYGNVSSNPLVCWTFGKGQNIRIGYLSTDDVSFNNNFIATRTLTRNSDISFTPTSGIYIRWGQTSASSAAGFVVPKAIYGIKYS